MPEDDHKEQNKMTKNIKKTMFISNIVFFICMKTKQNKSRIV